MKLKLSQSVRKVIIGGLTTAGALFGGTAAANASQGIHDLYLTNSTCQSGYFRVVDPSGSLNGDLNQNSGGSDVFICASKKATWLAPITDVAVARNHCPSPWQSVRASNGSNGDLNQGTGSFFKSTPTLKLCIQRRSGTPLKEIQLSPSRNMPAPLRAASVLNGANGDMGEGAGGRDVFLAIETGVSDYSRGYSAAYWPGYYRGFQEGWRRGQAYQTQMNPAVTCGEGTVKNGNSCIPSESSQSAFDRGVASVVRVTCDEGTELTEAGNACQPTAEYRDAAFADGRTEGITEGRNAGYIEGRTAGIAEGRIAGIASVKPLKCGVGTIVNDAEQSCEASNDYYNKAYQDGVDSIDLSAERQEAFDAGTNSDEMAIQTKERAEQETHATDCFQMGYCGEEGRRLGHYANATREFASQYGLGCRANYDLGKAWYGPNTQNLVSDTGYSLKERYAYARGARTMINQLAWCQF